MTSYAGTLAQQIDQYCDATSKLLMFSKIFCFGFIKHEKINNL